MGPANSAILVTVNRRNRRVRHPATSWGDLGESFEVETGCLNSATSRGEIAGNLSTSEETPMRTLIVAKNAPFPAPLRPRIPPPPLAGYYPQLGGSLAAISPEKGSIGMSFGTPRFPWNLGEITDNLSTPRANTFRTLIASKDKPNLR